jgi:hypothetical protein
MMTTSSALGKLCDTSREYTQYMREKKQAGLLVQQPESPPEIRETVQQKRKRIFNRDTGTLNLNLSGVPFWIWDEALHHQLRKMTGSKCCFVDMLGRPLNPKTGEECPLYPYEYEVLKALFTPSYLNPDNDQRRRKHLWIKKARGAGLTEFFIYKMFYLPCAFPDVYYDSQMAIVTGIRKATAVKVMDRMKRKLYQKLKIVTDFSESVMDVNGCIIEAYPANNPDSVRGLHNMKFIFYDEADSTPLSVIDDMLSAIEGYTGKNNPYIVINSTAKTPNGLMQRIEQQPPETCNYKRMFILADKLLGYIYTQQDLDLASTSPYYRQEYWGEYKGDKGNLFPQEYLDYAAGLVDELVIKDTMTGEIRRTISRPEKQLTVRDVISDYRFLGPSHNTSVGTDPAFNSSMFASVVFKEISGQIYVVKEAEMQAPSSEEGMEMQKRLIYQDYPSMHPKIWIDSSAVLFIRSLKKDIGEDPDYHSMTPDLLRESMLSPLGMTVCPIAFSKYGERLNYHLRRLLELGVYHMDKDVTPKLWISMNSAKYDEIHNKFDKKQTSHNDVFDSARLATCAYRIGNLSVL